MLESFTQDHPLLFHEWKRLKDAEETATKQLELKLVEDEAQLKLKFEGEAHAV